MAIKVNVSPPWVWVFIQENRLFLSKKRNCIQGHLHGCTICTHTLTGSYAQNSPTFRLVIHPHLLEISNFWIGAPIFLFCIVPTSYVAMLDYIFLLFSNYDVSSSFYPTTHKPKPCILSPSLSSFFLFLLRINIQLSFLWLCRQILCVLLWYFSSIVIHLERLI